MNHIYQRYLKLSSGLVAEARESYQLAKGECREVLFQRYMELQSEMEHYDYILHGSGVNNSSNYLNILKKPGLFSYKISKRGARIYSFESL